MTALSTYNFSRLAPESQTNEVQRLRMRMAHQRPMILPVLETIELPAAPLILDVGAGSGELTTVLAQAFPMARVLAIDAADIIRTHFNAGNERIVADGSMLPVDSCSIDVVCLRFVLQHTEARYDILAEAFRALRPGGHVWVCESDFTELFLQPQREALAVFVRAWSDSMRRRGGEPNIGHKVPAMLERTGFEVTSATATLEGTSADEFQWSAGGLAVLASATRRSIEGTNDERQAEVLADLEALRTEGWSYFGIWQTVGRKPLEVHDAIAG